MMTPQNMSASVLPGIQQARRGASPLAIVEAAPRLEWAPLPLPRPALLLLLLLLLRLLLLAAGPMGEVLR